MHDHITPNQDTKYGRGNTKITVAEMKSTNKNLDTNQYPTDHKTNAELSATNNRQNSIPKLNWTGLHPSFGISPYTQPQRWTSCTSKEGSTTHFIPAKLPNTTNIADDVDCNHGVSVVISFPSSSIVTYHHHLVRSQGQRLRSRVAIVVTVNGTDDDMLMLLLLMLLLITMQL
mmetsp:Transcript_32299/g.32659  ORF Transcript_32299/g.32659 Transcript_32299/m.32659 type:complete len:173 (-) Transcript_32299:1053-1571(-)